MSVPVAVVETDRRVQGWAAELALSADSPPAEQPPSSPIIPESAAPIVDVDDRPERVAAFVARYNHVNDWPQAYHGRPQSSDPHAHPLWKCPLVQMNARRRYEEFFLHLDHQVNFIDQTWSRYDLLKFIQDTVIEGLLILPDVDVDMRENLRGGNFGGERCYKLGHSPYPFYGDGREEIPGIAPFPCRRCWSCARIARPEPEPAVSDTGIGEEDVDEEVVPYPTVDDMVAPPPTARVISPLPSPSIELRGLGVSSPAASPATLALALEVNAANLAEDEREDALLAEQSSSNAVAVAVLSQSSSASGNSASSSGKSLERVRGTKRGIAEVAEAVDQENASGSGSGSGSTPVFVSRSTGYYGRVGYISRP
ncbi:unnamed protein product [Tilletia controversa]|nr:hypothetical protein CF336_g9495 [Tilletia laevis]KAE8180103.1 hypothetical protein CF335_g9360 [Tilletia laevis]CAD6979802.1 unnamed protein product [Tilletia controversa]